MFYSRCVYFDTSVQEWVSPRGVCSVNNNLEDGQDDYVDCSCKHLTHYAVKANALDPGLAGYPTAFYVASFICMVSEGGRSYTYYSFLDWLMVWLIDWWFDWLYYQPKSKSYCPRGFSGWKLVTYFFAYQSWRQWHLHTLIENEREGRFKGQWKRLAQLQNFFSSKKLKKPPKNMQSVCWSVIGVDTSPSSLGELKVRHMYSWWFSICIIIFLFVYVFMVNTSYNISASMCQWS